MTWSCEEDISMGTPKIEALFMDRFILQNGCSVLVKTNRI